MPNEIVPSAAPQLSVIIAVYGDWGPLARCLQSLRQQIAAPECEVIIVDDGSEISAPESVRSWDGFPLRIVRQPHAGIPAARNRGIQCSKGSVLVFTDADCLLQPGCLAALSAVVADSPQHSCFQLCLAGDPSNAVGRAEELRLMTFQKQMLQPNGSIRYLNTAGFAIRRERAAAEVNLFDPSALRGEDTLLLANLMQRGELPLFVPRAVVQHVISLPLLQCLRKDVRSAWLEGRTYDLIAAKRVVIRMSKDERVAMLQEMWRAASHDSIGRIAWFVVVLRQGLQRFVSVIYRCRRLGTSAQPTPTAPTKSV